MDKLISIIIGFTALFGFCVMIAAIFASVVEAWTKSRKTKQYWREKFADTWSVEERELLRASDLSESPQTLLHPVVEEAYSAQQQLLRATSEEKPTQ
ncbi:MAG TPA: hypothetical protein VKU00_05380 [Chthonomonadaceae bacterium]|nr:hypothetical protein [Chthonomonadaceae bacterium]